MVSYFHAGVAEQVDATDLKSVVNNVWVRVPSPVPFSVG